MFSTAVAFDERFDIERKASKASTGLADSAQQIDERYNVKDNARLLASKGLDRAQGLDATVTGGKITPVVACAFQKGLSLTVGGLAFLQGGYAFAKQQRQSH